MQTKRIYAGRKMSSLPHDAYDSSARASVFESWARRIGNGVRLIVPFLVLLAIWALISTQTAPDILPSPAAVANEGHDLITSGALVDMVVRSLRTMAVACALGIGGGILIGVVIGASRIAANILHPVLNFLAATSEIAWLPLTLIWFGFTTTAVTAVVIYTLIFPVIFNTVVGMTAVPQVYLNAISTMGGGRLRVFRNVLLPGALATIMTGIRLGIAYGWRTLIAAEMIAGVAGVGFMIFRAEAAGATAEIMLGMIVIGCLWLAMDRLILRPIERATTQRWGLVVEK